MNVPFVGLDIQYENLKPEITKTIESVFANGKYILAEHVKKFEENFAGYCGTEYSVGVASGTEAITLSLMAAGVEQGDEVVTVPNTAIPTICAITAAGANPVFVDVGEDYLIDIEKIEQAITRKTKAIVPVHLYGQVCNMDEIMKIAKKHNLFVVEDAAQAHGSELNSKRAGSFGDFGCFSFYPTKNLGTYGDGGLIATGNKELYHKLLKMRDYGRSGRDEFEIKGINSRLDEIHAAILNVKLKYLEAWTEKRRSIAAIYDSLLCGDVYKIPKNNAERKSNYHLYVIRTEKRDALRQYLKDLAVDTLVHYPSPAHLQKAFENLGYKEGDLPSAESFANQILSLPVYPELSEEKVRFVCEKINSFYEEN